MRIVYQEELAVAVTAAKQAGAIVRDFYDRAAINTHIKSDGSPVTAADLASDQRIRTLLSASFPDDGILTEESADNTGRLRKQRCWVVDPLDGTKQFIARTGNFDVLIALVVANRPVLGVAFQPSTGCLIFATIGAGAWIERDGHRQRLQLRPATSHPRLATATWFGAPESLPLLSRVANRLHTNVPDMLPVGISPRQYVPPDNRYDAVIGLTTSFGGEWDFAATDIIIHEAGGEMTDIGGQLHQYNKPDPHVENGVIMGVDPQTHQRVFDALQVELTSNDEPESTQTR